MADFNIRVDLNYISDADSIITYNPMWGGTYKGAFSYVKLDWDAQTDNGLQGYNVYYSVYPYVKNKANLDAIVATTHFEMQLPLFPQNIYFYFWISKVVNGVETFLNTEGYTTYDSATQSTIYEGMNPISPNDNFPETDNINDSMKDMMDRIKMDRTFATQLRGVECDIYFRRWGTNEKFGRMCSCTEDTQDADFMGSTRCPLCFSTGVVGGYYPPITMLVNFQAQPAYDYKGSIRGMTVDQTYDAWTTVPPFIREEDMMVRRIDGKRWLVSQVNSPMFRGSNNAQYFKLALLPMTDIRHIVSLSTINQALATIDDPRFNPGNRKDT